MAQTINIANIKVGMDIEELRKAEAKQHQYYGYRDNFDTLADDVVAHQKRALEGLTGSHAFIVFNDLGWAETQKRIPGLEAMVTALRPDIRQAGSRAILGTGEKKSWIEQILKKYIMTR